MKKVLNLVSGGVDSCLLDFCVIELLQTVSISASASSRAHIYTSVFSPCTVSWRGTCLNVTVFPWRSAVVIVTAPDALSFELF